MTELLEIFNMSGELLKVEDRKKFYSEIKKEYADDKKITKQVKRVLLILMNSKGRIFLQFRSKEKNENPGLYDKTIGGHVAAGDTFDISIVRECAEELGFPATIVPPEDFERSVKGTNTEIIGIFRKVDFTTGFISTRITQNNKLFKQAYQQSVYIGYYDGPIKFIDGECAGIKVFDMEDLKKDITTHPKFFTKDVIELITKYKKFLIPVKKL